MKNEWHTLFSRLESLLLLEAIFFWSFGTVCSRSFHIRYIREPHSISIIIYEKDERKIENVRVEENSQVIHIFLILLYFISREIKTWQRGYFVKSFFFSWGQIAQGYEQGYDLCFLWPSCSWYELKWYPEIMYTFTLWPTILNVYIISVYHFICNPMVKIKDKTLQQFTKIINLNAHIFRII